MRGGTSSSRRCSERSYAECEEESDIGCCGQIVGGGAVGRKKELGMREGSDLSGSADLTRARETIATKRFILSDKEDCCCFRKKGKFHFILSSKRKE